MTKTTQKNRIHEAPANEAPAERLKTRAEIGAWNGVLGGFEG